MSAGHAEEARLSRQIADVDKNQSELRNLVSRLQSHVITGTCPLCGEEHGTRDELLRRIARHVSIDAASSARTNVATVRERLKQLAERATNIERRRQEANRKIAETQQERQGLVSEIASYERAVSAQGISWGSSEFDLAQQLSSRQDQVLRAVDSVRQQLESIDASRVAARQSRATAEALLAAKSADAGTIRGEFESVRERHAQLRRDSRFLQSLFDLAEDQLASDHKASIDRLLEVDRAIATATADVAARKASHREAAQQLSTLLSQLNETRAQLTDHQKASARIVAQLEDTKLPQDSSADVVLSLLSDESRRQATLTNLRDLVANMEIAIDSATTAAVLAELQKSRRNKEATIEQAALRRDANQPWLKYFEAVSRLLSLQRDRATDEFTQEYGPRASIIQRRIRSVYGFDDIEITSRESAIYVRVTRRGEQLRPIDYFSQSQQQTLLLGLFLSACSSQTWSAFSPVFLDDPVTHFDDLNTYALLDLIVGLLGSEFPARQFVISTCDEKLLQLARQKFRYLGTRARFYRFSAIGEDGPVVTEIQTQ